MARAAAEAVGIAPDDVLTASTGVIGTPLPMDKLLAGIQGCARELASAPGAPRTPARRS